MQIEIGEGMRSVLIVEDEVIVAMAIEDLMRDLGVREVHLCSSVASALDVLSAHSIDCAILDLHVQDGNTARVADALAEKGVAFLFSSGSASEALEARHMSRPMISKPFLDDDLQMLVLDTWAHGRGIVRDGPQRNIAGFGATD